METSTRNTVVNTTTQEPDTTTGTTTNPVTSDTTTATTNTTQQNVNLMNIDVVDENSALNVLVGFLGVAQRRGTFAINESAKIYECIQMFQRASN